MKIFSKIRAQAMQFAILISVLVALVLSAFLLLTHTHSFFKIKSQELLQAFEQSNKLVFESLENHTIKTDTIVSQEEARIIKQTTSYHGVWSKQFSQVSIHQRKATRIAYIGSELSEKTPNLYVVNTNSPLVVVGNTRLEGNSYLPKQGVKAGNISGNYYQGNSLYYGRAIESKTTLPKLAPEWIKYLENRSNGIGIEDAHTVALKKELHNSFHHPVQVIYDTDPIFLEDEKIIGNIIIQSRSKIIVGSQSQLTDVVLIAPEIEIDNGVKGSFQGIATHKIKIGKGCYLSYPSSLVLLDKKIIADKEKNNLHIDPDFTIGKRTKIEGAVVYFNKNISPKNRIKTHLEIASDSEITGEVYCQGNIDFQGTVKGSLYTRQCIARQSGSVYLNHIYNGSVLINPVPDYAGLPFVNTKNSIAKWLY
ncbi:hypothetical protein [Aquimarina algiphila]|uniref:Polymer-forming cytoskeletal protein n=1 Tax=Aquimarina algiphila TaxID=2047982 RepID=A0A554VGY0_9FLAO|nr:hypothetical protein [Aquimarina algiphila]TSE06679.1 hypothetical protein FOF46_18400 [Aquimarina algiphila]